MRAICGLVPTYLPQASELDEWELSEMLIGLSLFPERIRECLDFRILHLSTATPVSLVYIFFIRIIV